MKRIVLTGGPQSGKSTILKTLKEEFSSQIILVPEVATLLLEGGFPVPGKHLPWSQEWQASFQSAIISVQKSIEEAYELMARANGQKVIVCDRGILDGAAYTPGGVEEFCRRYKINREEVISRYSAVIHLESLAVVDPEKYGKTGNESRFEPLERAQEIEKATKEVWKIHARHLVIDGRRGIEGKISEVMGIIRFLLSENLSVMT